MRALLFPILLAATSASAQQHRLTAWAGGGAWNADERPFHGALAVAYDLWLGVDARGPAAQSPGHLGLEYNTETLRLTFDGVRLSDRVEVGVGLTGEAFAAGVLRDYWQQGHNLEERTFLAHYVLAHAALKAQIDDRTYFEVLVAGRRWFFGESDGTGDGFRLPAEAWVFEPRLRYTWWRLDDDAGWRDRHRVFPRLRGVAAGVEAGVDARSDAPRWGAADDPRNSPSLLVFRPRQWLLAGFRAHDRVRLQLQESAAFGVGEDDLTRDRIGGLTPYAVPMAGAPWPAWLSERYVAGQGSAHVRVFDDFEVGPLVTATGLADPDRTGDDDTFGGHLGVGALADYRRGPWQLDLRGGWSPTLADDSGRAAWNAWVSLGWSSD